MNIQTIIQQASTIIRKYLSYEYKILLFGSHVNGNALTTSDIDIAVVGKQKVSANVMAKIRDEIDGIRTLRSIDVLDLMSVDEQYRANVLFYAKEISP